MGAEDNMNSTGIPQQQPQHPGVVVDEDALLAKYLRMDPYKEILVDIRARLAAFDPTSNPDARVAEWLHIQAQQAWLLTSLFQHPVVLKYPPRLAFRIALLKALLAVLEEEGTRIANTSIEGTTTTSAGGITSSCAKKGDGDQEEEESLLPWEEESIVTDAVLDLYLAWRADESSTGEASTKDEHGRFYTSYTLAPSASTNFVSFAVNSHFVNVGFALWPSSFVLVDLIATLLGTSPGNGTNSLDQLHRYLSLPLPNNRPPTIVELGAGVGLTPVVLDKVAGIPPRCFVTDYQPAILENCADNCERNDTPCTFIRAGTDPEVIQSCANGLAMLDWTETTEKYNMLRAIAPDLLVAADCVYDAEVLEGLNDTFRFVLTGQKGPINDDDLSAASDEPPLCNAAILVQTHRNDETQKALHTMIEKYADVTSYKYVPRESEEGGWALRALSSPWLQSVNTPVGKPAQALGGEYPLRSTGDYKVDMHELLFVHIIRGRKTTTTNGENAAPQN